MKPLLLLLSCLACLPAFGQTWTVTTANAGQVNYVPVVVPFAPSLVNSNNYNSLTVARLFHTNTFAATTSGNLLIAVVGYGSDITNITSGWILATNATADWYDAALYYKTADGTETSFVIKGVDSIQAVICYMEWSGASSWTLDKYNSAIGLGPATLTGPSTGTTTSDNELAIAAFGSYYDNVSFANWGSSFVEVCDQRVTLGEYNMLGVAVRVLTAAGNYNTTADVTNAGQSHNSGIIVTFK